jgi:toxin ParE1/3/4
VGSFSLTQAAKKDLKAIAMHTQQRWGKAQRKVYARQFDVAFHLLADNQETGSNCDFIRQDYRKFPNGSHVIFYRSLGEGEIQIVRILHKRMDVVRQLIGT